MSANGDFCRPASPALMGAFGEWRGYDYGPTVPVFARAPMGSPVLMLPFTPHVGLPVIPAPVINRTLTAPRHGTALATIDAVAVNAIDESAAEETAR